MYYQLFNFKKLGLICNVCKHRSLENDTTAASKRRVHAVLHLGIATSMLPKISMIFSCLLQ
ncbi:hypothetical protein BDF20DRAFT_887506 [Mycotypha africana]|uniref:uncharacterized protein n=1 Tax=Mycotypha africana TaxID=64632 RepID=UPI002300CF1D|nr:uncharacterized protein BDF20DRAFT_887370 [Mycotypha africana]XP_052933730.1 uncharacterized protein BDF20DRAFT_887506 [Mycotypha africana]KAI8971938.1 hypothetical protein BDF20DRAFT_887370 [Mycotypha africana]KAI8971963.1 hypothetical protein BDF20DRAFT_887506 [Mycotypha africana]